MNLRDIAKQYGRDTTGLELVERNGYIFFVNPKRPLWRYDPITLAVVGLGVGTGLKVAGTLRQGKQAEKIAKARAAIDIKNAEATRRRSVEEARIEKEKGRRLIETQKSLAAAGGIRINVGSPLVIETETRDTIAKNTGFILERGREEEGFFKSRAAIEIATGKAARKKSKFDALSQGLLGFGSIAFMGADAGLDPFGSVVGRNTLPAGQVGPTQPGALTRIFGRR